MSMIQINQTNCIENYNKSILFSKNQTSYIADFNKYIPLPIKYPPKNANTADNLLVEDFITFSKKEYTASILPDSSIYKSQQTYIIGNNLENKLKDRIIELSKLPNNWDGYDAKEILPDTKKYIKSLFNKIFSNLSQRISFVNKFEIFPTIKGGYQFEIRIGYRELEIEYSPTEKMLEILFIEISGEQETYQEEQISINKNKSLIDNLVNWLVFENV